MDATDVVGVWDGNLHVFGQTSRLVFRISLDSTGTLIALHDVPDYSLNNVPVTEAKLEGDRLFLKIGLFNATYEGTIGKDVITGRYSGSPQLSFPLNLKRKSKDPRALMVHLVPRMTAEGKRKLDYVYTPPETGEDGWPVTHAADMGIDTGKINSLVRHILAGGLPNLHSILVVKDGKLILDEYFHGFNRDKPHRVSSVGKVVTAAAVGVALDKGFIRDLHTPLVQFFPEYKDVLGEGEKAGITLYHLLTMTAGLKWSEHATSYFDPLNDLVAMRRSPDPLRNLFERPLAYHPGEQFIYNSGNMIALDALIERVAKVHPLVLEQNEVFTPMGIGNIRWDFSEGLYMVPRDMAKLGWLFTCRGEYGGKQILSPAWVDSAIQRTDRHRPRYFNHWNPMVFFVGSIPLRAYQAGGWGGQSITIIPAVNTVIVMTAANMLEPADYDVCIRDFILPAIVTPGYASTHPEIRHVIHQSRNLEWEKHWDTEMGCLKASARSLGIPVTDARLYGATGVGFLINIDETAAAKSMAVWNKQRAYDLCRNIGLNVESIWSHTSNKEFSSTQRLVWNRVRQSIDSGFVCYGFHFEDPIRYLVMGYDSLGYYYKGWGAEWGEGPVFWYDLGRTEIGLLGMHFVRPVSARAPFKDIIKQAFRFVLEFSNNSKQWVPDDCKAGPEGYTRWISLFESGKEDEYGASYNALVLAEARRFAVVFLEEARGLLDPSLNQLFTQAMQHYRFAAQHLDSIGVMFPLDAPPLQRTQNLKNQERRQAAVFHLRAAREAETEGLKTLDAIAQRL
jgi:CubicO group peptidase (beta-lactamase class C family)